MEGVITVQLLEDFRRRRQLARMLANAEDRGETIMTIPGYLVEEVSRLRWMRKVERASDKWAANVEEIPVTTWQDAVITAGRHRKCKPREH